ncbi:CC/Se motif family (seleno)protein [Sedimentibacter sp. B4]|uniref:CC/Se motif family (seleno)protein n=1 Tax=Sedimentibacter sp. B4 TaxID=304766 RepID=UPI0002E89BFF|nr:CC/Se motif family (seleno)protein [Sedimentibacter sp. B4]
MIVITEKAINFLNKKGRHEVIIEYPEYRASCECAFVQVPEIFAKKPKTEENYCKSVVDDIEVFISKQVTLPAENDVTIDLDSFLGIKSLTVSGFKSED